MVHCLCDNTFDDLKEIYRTRKTLKMQKMMFKIDLSVLQQISKVL